MRGGWVYILASRYRCTLYVGVTVDLARRMVEHREGRGSSFVDEHAVTRLVFVERHDDIEDAIVREKRVKEWRRAWKLRLVEEANPNWHDLFELINM